MEYKIKEIASIAGVSIRTLHHYDEIGILAPSKINESGYRIYSDEDLERLQQILFFKELDFTLKDIKEIIDCANFDKKQALKAHRKLLLEKKRRLEKIISTVDRTLSSVEGGIKMSKKEMFESFDMTEIEKYKKDYAEEVREKYDKKVVEECDRKTSSYTKNDWKRIQGRGNEIFQKIAELMDREPTDAVVQKLIGEYRQYITDNFYECTLEIFSGLADLYINDVRFTKNIDKHGDGLSQYLHDAIKVYCDNK